MCHWNSSSVEAWTSMGPMTKAECRGCLETGRSFKAEEMHLALLVHRCPGCFGQQPCHLRTICTMDTHGTMSPKVVGDLRKFGDRIGLFGPPFLNLLLVPTSGFPLKNQDRKRSHTLFFFMQRFWCLKILRTQDLEPLIF